MIAIAINGSPRKSWNTATLLQNALDGAASVGADTELIHLRNFKFNGCSSCFVCLAVQSEMDYQISWIKPGPVMYSCLDLQFT